MFDIEPGSRDTGIECPPAAGELDPDKTVIQITRRAMTPTRSRRPDPPAVHRTARCERSGLRRWRHGRGRTGGRSRAGGAGRRGGGGGRRPPGAAHRSEQNPDLTGKDLRLLASRIRPGAPGPVEAFKRHGADFVVADTLEKLVAGMNRLADPGVPTLAVERLRELIEARDREIVNTFAKDAQVTAIRGARNYRGDRLIRVATPHRLLDPKAGPLIAVKLHVLSRKTLGGLETDLSGRCLRPGGAVFPGLYAAGEVSGFGGGGMMGYNALEGTFLGGRLFSGRTAGRAAALATA